MSSPKIFIDEQLAQRDEIARRIELVKNQLPGAHEDSVGSSENFIDVTQREIDKLEAEIVEIDARIAQLKGGNA
jgi:cell division protein FtsB